MSQTHVVVVDRQRLLSTLQWMVRARSYSDTLGEVILAHDLAEKLAGQAATPRWSRSPDSGSTCSPVCRRWAADPV